MISTFNKCTVGPQGSLLEPSLFLPFVWRCFEFCNGRVRLTVYADDVIIYTSAATSDELQMKLQLCVDNVHQWYNMSRLTVYKNKAAVMGIGSKPSCNL